MPSVEEALRARLIANGTVSGLVSTRVYPETAPQGATFPFIAYTRTNTDHVRHLLKSSGLVEHTIRFTAFSENYKNAQAIGEAIRLALDSFTGSITVGASSVTIETCFLLNDETGYLTPTDGSETTIYTASSDYMVWTPETVPSHA